MILAPWIAILCLIGGGVLLASLAVIDFKTYLLPNKYVFPFGLLALPFHFALDFRYLTPLDMVLGGMCGFAILYGLRFVANHIMKQDTLGLGDVKLMGAAGLWLGPQSVFLAMSIGAMAGLLHGVGLACIQLIRKEQPDLSKLSVPAGPGFALGIAVTGLYMFWDFLQSLWPL